MRIRAADEFCVDIFPSVDGRPIIGHSAPFPPPGQRTAHVRQASVRPRPAPQAGTPIDRTLNGQGEWGRKREGPKPLELRRFQCKTPPICAKIFACLLGSSYFFAEQFRLSFLVNMVFRTLRSYLRSSKAHLFYGTRSECLILF